MHEKEQTEPSVENTAVDANTEAAVSRSVVIDASEAELKAFDDLGPDDPTVQAWLEQNGVTENDSIVVNGNVYVANANDFLTRDVSATLEWAAAARNIVDVPELSEPNGADVTPTAEVEALEDGIDARTAEILEEEPRVTREEAEKIGEKVVDESGVVTLEGESQAEIEEANIESVAEVASTEEVNRDAERNTEVARSIIRSYETNITGEADIISEALARSELRLDEFAMLGKNAENMIRSAETTRDTFDAFIRGIDNYPFPAIQTKLEQIASSIQADANSLRRIESGSEEEIKQVLGEVAKTVRTGAEDLENTDARISGHFNEHVNNAEGLPADIPDSLELNAAPHDALTELGTVVNEATLELNKDADGTEKPLHQKLNQVATQLFDLLAQSRMRPIDSSDIYQLSRELQVALTPDQDGSGDLAQVYSDRAALSQRVVDAIRKTRTTLDAPFERA